jgi:hypothetical protein
MNNRDYTKRPTPYKKNVIILKAEATQVARTATKAMLESGNSELLVELLVKEYYGNNSLYKKHRAEYLR